MTFASTSTRQLKVVVNKPRSRRSSTMIMWTTSIMRGSACKLVLTYCSELCSVVIDVISWYLVAQATLCPSYYMLQSWSFILC